MPGDQRGCFPPWGCVVKRSRSKRATSSLLAVMHAVPELGHALLFGLGAPKGRIETYTELQLRSADGKRCIPDGAIIVERGSKEWSCLIEVKTGKAQLQAEQVSRYLDWARDNRFDAVLTISNEITTSSDDSPFTVDKRKLKKVSLHHLSWWRILTEAIVQHRHRGVTDPDQAWLLGELIAYLDHERSGASGFQGMGDSWVAVRASAANETLRPRDPEAHAVAKRWEQFVEYVALGLGQDLGRDVTPARARKSNVAGRIDETVQRLADTGKLEAALKVPNAVGNVLLEADLRTKKVTTSVEVDAPREGRPRTRINWLLRQLRHAPADLRIDVAFANSRETSSLLLGEANDAPERLLSPTDPRREPRAFRVALTRKMGAKRGKEDGSFVKETRKQTIDFYRDLVQDLRGWQPSPPKLPRQAKDETTAPASDPPLFSAVNERQPGEGADLLPR